MLQESPPKLGERVLRYEWCIYRLYKPFAETMVGGLPRACGFLSAARDLLQEEQIVYMM